jgi:toxin ParE1/3/4
VADKPIRLRALAAADLDDAADYYRDNAGEQVALDFVDEVQAAFALISSGPGIGSLRYSYDLDIPGLRAFSVSRFDHAVFYVETDDLVDVWRILHTRRDLPETLRHSDAFGDNPK